MSDDNAPGFYGKLPALGDFVTRRLPREFVEPGDKWLQLAITASRAQMEGDWLPAYLSGPIWRFALAPGVCGQSAWAGALMPSVDKVGRYFPLTMAAKHARNPFAAICGAEDCAGWFDRVEEALLFTLGDGAADVQSFDVQAQTLTPCWSLDAPATLPRVAAFEEASGWFIPATPAVFEAVALLLAHLVHERLDSPSIWWTKGSERIESGLLVCQGLPSPDRFAGMLDARWRTHPSTVVEASETNTQMEPPLDIPA